MMKKKNRKSKSIKKAIKLINIALVLLCISPIFYYMMVQIQLSGSGKDFLDMIEQSPNACITMVYVCLNPFLAYILKLMKSRIELAEDGEVVIVNLGIVMLTQVLSLNVLYLCFIAYILYLMFDIYQLSMKEIRKHLSFSFLFSKVGGSIILLILNIFLSMVNLSISL